MNGNRRDQIQIMVDLLKIIKYEHQKTQICHKVNTSYIQLLVYLELLNNLKFIKFSTEKKVYVSDNGYKFLKILGDKFD